MIRVTVEIVPFGEETEKRVIDTMVISRRQVHANPCDYTVKAQDETFIVKQHRYEDGAWELVRRAVECLVDPSVR